MKFQATAVLSVYTGRMCSPSLDEVYDLVNFLLDDQVFTHQLPDALDAVQDDLEKQFPWLVDFKIDRELSVGEFLAEVNRYVEKYGELEVSQATGASWRKGAAIERAVELFGADSVEIILAESE